MSNKAMYYVLTFLFKYTIYMIGSTEFTNVVIKNKIKIYSFTYLINQ